MRNSEAPRLFTNPFRTTSFYLVLFLIYSFDPSPQHHGFISPPRAGPMMNGSWGFNVSRMGMSIGRLSWHTKHSGNLLTCDSFAYRMGDCHFG
ncbi:hypothetical protein TNIN_260801 [Trichonephila inaurata madagascariensis]|uniref:Uncharacterized protein n=1 Tax=Trichonephila inaurata madagascariensis TaxID=2747483 RepID=A0A8X6XXD1_9ARAC|nr:hypothetical protein TNIN_260801 [Trichonephila inaurata madagascariensis]